MRSRLGIADFSGIDVMMRRHPGNSFTIRFALPSAELSPYVTTYYRSELAGPQYGDQADGPMIEDYLHPEWSNIRFMDEGWSRHAIGNVPHTTTSSFSVTGPTSLPTHFCVRPGRSWGIGLMPLGWAALIGAEASDYADRVVDGWSDPAFDAFAPLAQALADSSGGFAEELALIEAHMASLADCTAHKGEEIAAINAALVDPDIVSVTDLAAHVGMHVRSLERLSKRAFGFTPKLLMRRQRFLRSLAQFMLDPSLSWLSTLDYHYHDQAHFVRDFKRFMGMSPTAYAQLDKPMLMAAAQARMAIAGQAVQGLHGSEPAGK